MINNLIDILRDQNKALQELLVKLDDQHKLIMNKDIFGLEAIVDDIQLINKKIAELEVKRRKVLGSSNIKEVVESSNNKDLDYEFRAIGKVLHMVKLQKDTNEILIRQGLSFTNKLLEVLNPKKETRVYNSYGQMRR